MDPEPVSLINNLADQINAWTYGFWFLLIGAPVLLYILHINKQRDSLLQQAEDLRGSLLGLNSKIRIILSKHSLTKKDYLDLEIDLQSDKRDFPSTNSMDYTNLKNIIDKIQKQTIRSVVVSDLKQSKSSRIITALISIIFLFGLFVGLATLLESLVVRWLT